MTAKIKNNSKCTIKDVMFRYEVDGQKQYLGTNDTLLPNDISTECDSEGPKSLDKKDAKFLEAQIEVIGTDKKEYSVSYDAKLDKYEVYIIK